MGPRGWALAPVGKRFGLARRPAVRVRVLLAQKEEACGVVVFFSPQKLGSGTTWYLNSCTRTTQIQYTGLLSVVASIAVSHVDRTQFRSHPPTWHGPPAQCSALGCPITCSCRVVVRHALDRSLHPGYDECYACSVRRLKF
jgi:hypothetical protein